MSFEYRPPQNKRQYYEGKRTVDQDEDYVSDRQRLKNIEKKLDEVLLMMGYKQQQAQGGPQF